MVFLRTERFKNCICTLLSLQNTYKEVRKKGVAKTEKFSNISFINAFSSFIMNPPNLSEFAQNKENVFF